MKRLKNVRQLEQLLPGAICDVPPEGCDDDTTTEALNASRRRAAAGLFASPVYLVETRQDLGQVCPAGSGEGAGSSLLDAPSDAFDFAGWIGDGRQALFAVIDGEGTRHYIVPGDVAATCGNVADSIAMATG